MSPNKRATIFTIVMSMAVLAMLFLYVNFLHDKPAIEQQNQQNLTPNQIVNGTSKFIKDMTTPLQGPPAGSLP